MSEKDTVITVGITRKDEYGNLWVTPSGGGEEVKIGAKRKQLHDLFEQGKAIMLHWETYMDKPYVFDAKLVEGELPQPPKHTPTSRPAPQEIGMWWKEVGELYRTNKLMELFGKKNAIDVIKVYRGQLLSTLEIPFDGSELPQFLKKPEDKET